jgi:hypothetical protein
MRFAVLVMVVAACSTPTPVHVADAAAAVDAATALDYKLGVNFDSTRADMPTVFIDGVATMMIDEHYATFSGPIRHEIELRYADQVLAHTFTSDSPGDCGPPDVAWTSIDEGVGALASGDLRAGGAEWRGDDGQVCSADGFGLPHCSCQPTERCAPRVIRAQPLFTQMACAPIGPKAAGDPCTLTDDPAGAYDDCGEQLVCIAGTCTPFCDPSVPAQYPPEAHGCP